MTFLIRPATMADLDVLTEIEARGFPPEEKASRERFEERLKAFGAHFLILEDAGKPIGLIDGMVTDSEKIVDEMFEDATIHNPKGRGSRSLAFVCSLNTAVKVGQRCS